MRQNTYFSKKLFQYMGRERLSVISKTRFIPVAGCHVCLVTQWNCCVHVFLQLYMFDVHILLHDIQVYVYYSDWNTLFRIFFLFKESC